MGKLLKGIAKFTVATAAVGGLCYVFRDKIKETKVYKDYDMDTKINKVKTTIKEKMPKIFENEEDIVAEDEIFFDDLDLTAEDVERDYVDIEADADSAVPSEAPAEAEPVEEAAETDEKDVPTIDL